MKEDWERLPAAARVPYVNKANRTEWLDPVDAIFPPPGVMAIAAPPVAPQDPFEQRQARQNRARGKSRRAVSLEPGSGPILPALARRAFPQLTLPPFMPGHPLVHPGPLFPGLAAPAPGVAPAAPVTAPIRREPAVNPHTPAMHGFAPDIIEVATWQKNPIPVPPSRLPKFQSGLPMFDRPNDNQANGVWKCVERIGEGAYGEVHLWIRVKEDDRVHEVSPARHSDFVISVPPSETHETSITSSGG